jgi:hypothetical protein
MVDDDDDGNVGMDDVIFMRSHSDIESGRKRVHWYDRNYIYFCEVVIFIFFNSCLRFTVNLCLVSQALPFCPFVPTCSGTATHSNRGLVAAMEKGTRCTSWNGSDTYCVVLLRLEGPFDLRDAMGDPKGRWVGRGWAGPWLVARPPSVLRAKASLSASPRFAAVPARQPELEKCDGDTTRKIDAGGLGLDPGLAKHLDL